MSFLRVYIQSGARAPITGARGHCHVVLNLGGGDVLDTFGTSARLMAFHQPLFLFQCRLSIYRVRVGFCSFFVRSMFLPELVSHIFAMTVPFSKCGEQLAQSSSFVSVIVAAAFVPSLLRERTCQHHFAIVAIVMSPACFHRPPTHPRAMVDARDSS